MPTSDISVDDKWADIIRDQQSSSLTVKDWCSQHQVSKDQFYYWKRKLKDKFVESQLQDIIPISSQLAGPCCTSCTTDTTVPTFSSVIISINNISIEITNNTSELLLIKVIKAVQNA